MLDGDGSVLSFSHHPTRKTYPTYEYRRLWTLFHSASRAHLEWLRSRLHRCLGIKGLIDMRRKAGRHDMFRLKYGNLESKVLLTRLYEDPTSPRLMRKWKKWDDYRERKLCADGGT